MEEFVAILRENGLYMLAAGAGVGIFAILNAFGLFKAWSIELNNAGFTSGGDDCGDCGGGGGGGGGD